MENKDEQHKDEHKRDGEKTEDQEPTTIGEAVGHIYVKVVRIEDKLDVIIKHLGISGVQYEEPKDMDNYSQN